MLFGDGVGGEVEGVEVGGFRQLGDVLERTDGVVGDFEVAEVLEGWVERGEVVSSERVI